MRHTGRLPVALGLMNPKAPNERDLQEAMRKIQVMAE
jgi:hypothetical protein